MFTLEAVQNEIKEAVAFYQFTAKRAAIWEQIVYNLTQRINEIEAQCPGFEPNDWICNRKLDDAYRAYDEAVEVQNHLDETLEREEQRIEALQKLIDYYKAQE